MNDSGNRKKHSLAERLRYRFDSRMSKGSIGMIGLLGQVTLVIILIIAVIVFILCRTDGAGFTETLWDTMAYTVNAWLPFSEEGSFSFLIPTAIASLCGVLITSILIGFIGSAIEDKVTALRRGNSVVLEEGHIVILGFIPGEYELLRQLVLSASGKPLCIVIAGDMEKDEMEELIRDNIETPAGVRIICRRADVTDIQ